MPESKEGKPRTHKPHAYGSSKPRSSERLGFEAHLRSIVFMFDATFRGKTYAVAREHTDRATFRVKRKDARGFVDVGFFRATQGAPSEVVPRTEAQADELEAFAGAFCEVMQPLSHRERKELKSREVIDLRQLRLAD